eukprot:ctg_765.g301
MDSSAASGGTASMDAKSFGSRSARITGAVASYWVVSISMVFLNKAVLSRVHGGSVLRAGHAGYRRGAAVRAATDDDAEDAAAIAGVRGHDSHQQHLPQVRGGVVLSGGAVADHRGGDGLSDGGAARLSAGQRTGGALVTGRAPAAGGQRSLAADAVQQRQRVAALPAAHALVR